MSQTPDLNKYKELFKGTREEIKRLGLSEPIPENLNPTELRLWLCDYQLKNANPAKDTEFIFTLVKIKKHLKEKL